MDCRSLLIGNEQERRRIIIDCILYIKTEDYLSTFHLSNDKNFTCSKPLSEIAASLPGYFLQINRSCVVNMNKIQSLVRGKRQIVLSDSTILDVSIRRFKALQDALARHNDTLTR